MKIKLYELYYMGPEVEVDLTNAISVEQGLGIPYVICLRFNNGVTRYFHGKVADIQPLLNEVKYMNKLGQIINE